MPGHKVRTVRVNNKVGKRGFRVADVTVHADTGADVAHHRRHRVGDDLGNAVGEFKQFRRSGPRAHLHSAVNRAGTDVIHPGRHGFNRRENVLPTFLGGVAIDDFIATGDDGIAPRVRTGW